MQFLDKDNLVIEIDRLKNQSIAALDDHTMQGNKLIPMPGALQVVRVTVIATRHPDSRPDLRR